jgi:hypothetical protein
MFDIVDTGQSFARNNSGRARLPFESHPSSLLHNNNDLATETVDAGTLTQAAIEEWRTEVSEHMII